jgi:hypothetical protein
MVCSLCGYELVQEDANCTVCGAGSAVPAKPNNASSKSTAAPVGHSALRLACVDLAELLAQSDNASNSNKQGGSCHLVDCRRIVHCMLRCKLLTLPYNVLVTNMQAWHRAAHT